MHWTREIEKWTEMRVVVLHGTKPCRDVIREHRWWATDSNGFVRKDIYKYVLYCQFFILPLLIP